MPAYKRLITQVHDIHADTPQQADQIARARAQAVNTALRPLGAATAWAPTISEADGADGQLLDILDGTYLLDEIDDDPERHPRTGYVEIEHTTVPERLLAWRDAAVQAALADAERARTLARFMSHDAEQALIGHLDVDCALSRVRNRADTLLTLQLGRPCTPEPGNAPGNGETAAQYVPVLSTGPADPNRPWLLSHHDTGLLHYQTGAEWPTAFPTQAHAEKYATNLAEPERGTVDPWDEPLPATTAPHVATGNTTAAAQAAAWLAQGLAVDSQRAFGTWRHYPLPAAVPDPDLSGYAA